MSLYATKPAPANFRALKRDSLLRVAPTIREKSAKGSVGLNPWVFERPSDNLTFREVIVPLDGSPYAEHALPWALQIASLAGTRLRLVHVHQQMQPAFHERRLALYREFDRLLREPVEEYMAGVVRRIARASTVTVTPTVVNGRHIADHLSDLVASTSDIVVMATRRRNCVSRLLRGSALDAVVHRREAPILHVRGYSCPVDFTARPSLRHALVPLDGSPESEDVLRPVSALSKLTDGRQTLLRVVQSSGLFSCGDGRSSEEARELTNSPVAYLDALAKEWRSKLPRVLTSVAWSDASLTRAILAEVDEQEVDFIAMTTRARSRLSRLFRPSVFDRLVRRARTPILVVKQRDDEDHPGSLSA
jgi:nucleotide-binding universal stress UspA family protein